MGRKKSQNPRTYGYRIRLTKDEHDMLIKIAESRNIEISRLLRDFILEQANRLNEDEG